MTIPELPTDPDSYWSWVGSLGGRQNLSDERFRVLAIVGVEVAEGHEIPTAEMLTRYCPRMTLTDIQGHLDALSDQGWLRRGA